MAAANNVNNVEKQISVPDSENMIRHHQNGHPLAMEGHPPSGEARRPPIGGRHSPTLHGGWASMHGGQRPIPPQVLTKESRPPLLPPPLYCVCVPWFNKYLL